MDASRKFVNSTCSGLIPCTPVPTQGVIGLTSYEAQRAGEAVGFLLGVGLMILLVTIVILVTLALAAATR